VAAAMGRWRIERDYHELNSKFGLHHYEGRNWRGFHHHASLCIAAYGFLMRERLQSKRNAARFQAPAVPTGLHPRGSRSHAATRPRLDRYQSVPLGASHRARTTPVSTLRHVSRGSQLPVINRVEPRSKVLSAQGHMSKTAAKTRPSRSRPGGRSERVRKAVAVATLKLIKTGRLDFDLQDVAQLAGVHRTTIYRRWPDRASLIGEALTEHTSRIDIKFTGDWRADVRSSAFILRDFLADPTEIALNSLLAAPNCGTFSTQVEEHWHPLIARFEQPIRDAQARGEIGSHADPKMLVAMMFSTITAFIVFIKVIPDDDFIEQLIAQITNACAPPLNYSSKLKSN